MFIKANEFLFACFSVVFFVASSMFTANLLNTAYGQDQNLPVDIGDIVTQNNITNLDNSSNMSMAQSDGANPCNMPPCPPGHACIQSCPQ